MTRLLCSSYRACNVAFPPIARTPALAFESRKVSWPRRAFPSPTKWRGGVRGGGTYFHANPDGPPPDSSLRSELPSPPLRTRVFPSSTIYGRSRKHPTSDGGRVKSVTRPAAAAGPAAPS
jgi:hypothetical protein